jgi:hypothetical protein
LEKVRSELETVQKEKEGLGAALQKEGKMCRDRDK